jgi:hypothetical protein
MKAAFAFRQSSKAVELWRERHLNHSLDPLERGVQALLGGRGFLKPFAILLDHMFRGA